VLFDYMIDLNELKYALKYSCVNFLIWMLNYVDFCWAKLKVWDFRFCQNLVQWNRNTGFVNHWIVFKFCMDIPMICFYSLTVEILKIITFGLLLSENGALSAIPTEGNCAERPKGALHPIPTEVNCTERPKGALS